MTVDADDLVSLGSEVLGEVATDESLRAGDKCLHRRPATGASVEGMVGEFMQG
jgi:hypothetical protein